MSERSDGRNPQGMSDSRRPGGPLWASPGKRVRARSPGANFRYAAWARSSAAEAPYLWSIFRLPFENPHHVAIRRTPTQRRRGPQYGETCCRCNWEIPATADAPTEHLGNPVG